MEESRFVEATVYVAEEFDTDIDTRVTWWTGRFFCSLQGPGDLFEDGPSDVSVEEAIAWGRARADRVLVRIGDGDHYSAGAVPIGDPTVEPWPLAGITLERRMWPGQEHLLRSASDPPIWWDVVVGIGAPGMDEPGAVERLIDALHAERPPPGPGLQGQVLLKIHAATAQMAEEEARAAVLEAYRLTAKLEGRHGFTMGLDVRPSKFQGFSIE